jgi:hypothetical protein
MADYNIQMKVKNSSGTYDNVFPKSNASFIKMEDGTSVQENLENHRNDPVAHITAAERTKWNNTLAGFSSLESIGLTDEDFTGLSASDAFTLLLTKMYAAGSTANPVGSFPVLKIYIVKDGGGNYPILSTIVRTKLNADVGVSASTTEGVLIIDGGIATTAQNKITFYCNAGSGDNTVEYTTFFDNTLGTFKSARTADLASNTTSIAGALHTDTVAPTTVLAAGTLWAKV